jgi:hypothetical protein
VARRNESKWRYESHRHALLPWRLFLRRAAAHVILTVLAVAVSVFLGTVGYHVLGMLPWVDAFLNASMILGGMGPVDPMKTTAAKIFAALYALYSGLFFIAVMGLLLAPWLHRMLHRVHMDEEKTTTPTVLEAK